jgi:PleD family two-component response regulator
MLDELLQRRAEAQAQLTARGLPFITERRRQPRLDLDITDPADYVKRRKPPIKGAVLIIDKSGALRDHMATLIGESIPVEWTESAVTAVRLCEETAISVVFINTSTPGIDPYGLAAAIKAHRSGERIAIVLLVGTSFHYHSARAKAAGVRGILDKPVADRHLVATLKRLMSFPL